jgi:hypothetical protein
MLGHILKGGSLGNGVTEKCVTATEQAVETPEGGRDRPRTTTASRHRRAASRSGGATSAERDGRPVLGSRQCPTQPRSVPVAGIRDRRPVTVTAAGLGTAAVAVSVGAAAADSPRRVRGSDVRPNEVLRIARGGCQAPLKRPREASPREAAGGRLAPLPWAPHGARPTDAPLLGHPGARASRAPLSAKTRALAGVTATFDARGTWDGCRASAGRHPGEGRSILFQRCPAPARASRRTNWGVPAGVQSLRMCRRRFEHAWAHSQGGHPREWRDGEVRHSHQEGRRDARRWPTSTEDDNRLTPPQGGEPERRRDERRTRRQAGATENRRLKNHRRFSAAASSATVTLADGRVRTP